MKPIFYISLFLSLAACNRDKNSLKQVNNNIGVFIHDQSLNKENPSLQLSIDNQDVFQTDSITKSKPQDFEIELGVGKHIVHVQTLNKQFRIFDTIDIIKANQRYLLSISFHYNPPVDWFKDYVVKHTYSNILIHNKLKSDTTIKWLLDSLTRQVERENMNSLSPYKANERHFEIGFTEQPMLE